jgi:hypothetical protein
MKKGKRQMRLSVLVLTLVVCGLFPAASMALETEFHGYLESNVVLRDTNGWQYGFMDEGDAIQQRNVLKFDVDAYPRKDFGSFSFDKVHLTYRGAYDSIFDLRRDTYDQIREKSPADFELGKDDIQFENDLREASFDITYDGAGGNSFLRVGRQLVSWGEVAGTTILDVVNPMDNSFQMFFQNPDELKTPLWMARYNHSLPTQAGFALNFDLVAIPDVRPTQFAPLDLSKDAPYAFLFESIPYEIKEDVDDDKVEWGANVSTTIGEYTDASFIYFEGYSDNPGMQFTNIAAIPIPGLPPGLYVAPTGLTFTHPWTRTYGFTFNRLLTSVDMVLKGEFGVTEDTPIATSPPAGPPPLLPPFVPPGTVLMPTNNAFEQKDIYTGMLGVDKNVWARWLSPAQVNLGFQWIHDHIDDYETSLAPKEDVDLFSLQVRWQWLNGNLVPAIFAFYDTQENWMSQTQLTYNINRNWYTQWSTMAFWGDKGSRSRYAPMVETSEMTFKVGFQW